MLKAETKEWVTPTVLSTLILIFIVDSLTSKGIADYIFYFLPVALSALHNNKTFPVRIALVTTCLAVVGYLLSPASDIERTLSIINRFFAILSMWGASFLGTQVI
ncbi:MAG TPA: hypothetical protein VKZ84_00575, partial [Bacteriovoracaceae bacterium]|nr:hypothetical protein [Bacteriovoracaceae bacterium]